MTFKGGTVRELTITDTHRAIQKQRLNCQPLTRRYIKRIKTYNKVGGLNAIIYINPGALQRARALDQQYAADKSMKRLHCIPVILKDNFDTADMPTEAGSIALRGSTPPDDAYLVRRLRNNDAIIVAKANMGEWAFSPYETVSSTHGITRNAYDTERVPAGSSGGTASAIAANFGIIGMGTDTGNSIRGPAAHLALVGLRSTLGATSRDGIVPLLLNRDVGGPLTRTVTDSAIVYSVIAGVDSADPLTAAAAGRVRADYRDYLIPDGLKGARLGVLRALVDERPLLLALDDLQWLDAGSAGLLFHLGRELRGHRILILGAYRPEEVALGRPKTSKAGRVAARQERHPLEGVLAEFQRRFGDIWLEFYDKGVYP